MRVSDLCEKTGSRDFHIRHSMRATTAPGKHWGRLSQPATDHVTCQSYASHMVCTFAKIGTLDWGFMCTCVGMYSFKFLFGDLPHISIPIREHWRHWTRNSRQTSTQSYSFGAFSKSQRLQFSTTASFLISVVQHVNRSNVELL